MSDNLDMFPSPTIDERRARIALWVEKLRSGEYAQAQGALKEEKAYCCLGVACDIYRIATGRGEWIDGCFEVGPESSDMKLPLTVARWFGLGDVEDPEVYAPALLPPRAALLLQRRVRLHLPHHRHPDRAPLPRRRRLMTKREWREHHARHAAARAEMERALHHGKRTIDCHSILMQHIATNGGAPAAPRQEAAR